MSQQELQRIKVIENVVEGRIKVGEAAELLSLSRRQVQRLRQSYRAGDVAWVRHGNRGKEPANRIDTELRQKILELARGRYRGFNDTHLTAKLTQVEKVAVSRATVQRILRAAGLTSPQKRRSPKYRSRRERREQEGVMLQTDGSRHDWLETRGPKLTLLGFIDDATSKVPVAQFQLEGEDTAGYLRITRQVVEQQGIPLSIYRDQHSTFQRNLAQRCALERGRTTGRQSGAHSVGPLLARVGNHLHRGPLRASQGSSGTLVAHLSRPLNQRTSLGRGLHRGAGQRGAEAVPAGI